MVNSDGSIAPIGAGTNENDAPDFTVDDLTLLKEIFLNLEKTVDEIKLPNPLNGETFTGGYIFSLLEMANVSAFHDFRSFYEIIIICNTCLNANFLQ